MRTNTDNSHKFAAMAFAALLFSVALLSSAVVAVGQETQSGSQQTQTNQTGLPGDPIRQLNLTAEQAEKIRAIREQNREERFAVNQRLRQARRAMNDAITADNASEALIEQRARELAEAQVAATRMNAITQLRIRRVLTPEQLTKLRALQQQALILQEQGRNRGNQDQMRPRERLQRRRDAIQRDGAFRPKPRPRVPGNFPAGQKP
jgi:Spy/CpxP family protein refolding chaperone